MDCKFVEALQGLQSQMATKSELREVSKKVESLQAQLHLPQQETSGELSLRAIISATSQAASIM